MFAIPYIFIMIVIITSGQLADYIRMKNILSTTAVRKIQTVIGIYIFSFFISIKLTFFFLSY